MCWDVNCAFKSEQEELSSLNPKPNETFVFGKCLTIGLFVHVNPLRLETVEEGRR